MQVPFKFCNWFCDQVLSSVSTFSMELLKKQLICVQFTFRVGQMATETHCVLREAYSDDALIQIMTHKWFRCFKNGRTSTDDDEQSGQPFKIWNSSRPCE
jgi:hypothetical protein